MVDVPLTIIERPMDSGRHETWPNHDDEESSGDDQSFMNGEYPIPNDDNIGKAVSEIFHRIF